MAVFDFWEEQTTNNLKKMTSSAHRLDDTSKIRTVDVTESTEKRSFSDLHLGPNLTQGNVIVMNQFFNNFISFF